MDDLIIISHLNDFIFCPISIYFHNLEQGVDPLSYQTEKQLSGTHAHAAVDHQKYSSKKTILQGISVCSQYYRIIGKIDTFDVEKGILSERKRKITRIYDGYIFQLYAQCFALREQGYQVKKLQFYSVSDNRVYPIHLPEEDLDMFYKFEKLLEDMMDFDYSHFVQTNKAKCENCIYEELCYFSLLKEVSND